MAILFDASTNGGNATGTSLTFSHTTGGGVNRILFVAVTHAAGAAQDRVTGITYAGIAMTRIDLQSPGSGTNYLYYLIAPATGANNVVVSLSESLLVHGVAASYTGAKQSGVPDASGTSAVDPATSDELTINTVADNCWVVSTAGRKSGSGATMSAGTGVTNSRQVNAAVAIGDSGPKTPAGSVSHTWNIDASTGIGIVMASFAPAPDAVAVGDEYPYFL